MREHHILQVQQPSQSFQTAAYQTNTIKTMKKKKKKSKGG